MASTAMHLASSTGGTALASQLAANEIESMFQSTPEQLVRQDKRIRRWTITVVTIGLFSFFWALFTMWWHASYVVYAAFVFPLVTAPYAIRQRRQLNRLPTLVYVINQVRRQVNHFTRQNNLLQAENDRLEHEQARLAQAEAGLAEIAKKSGTNVTHIRKLVDENGRIQREMKRLLDAQELQQLLTVILQSDRDNDGTLSEQEVHILMSRVQAVNRRSETVVGVLDEESLRAAFLEASLNGHSTTSMHRKLARSYFSTDPDDRDWTELAEVEEAYRYVRCFD